MSWLKIPEFPINFWALWSKTDLKEPSRWHALPWHLVEVGAVAEAMWHRATAPAVKARLKSHIGIDDDILIGKFIGFLAALHDLGKATPRFQALAPVQRERLADVGIHLAHQNMQISLRHSLLSTYLLKTVLVESLGFPLKIAKRHANITGAHHGRFWNVEDVKQSKAARDLATGENSWHAVHIAIAEFLKEAFGLPADIPDALKTWRPSYADALVLTGFISVADWVGSNQDYFDYRTDARSPQDTYKESQEAAYDALSALGWLGSPLHIPSDDFLDTIRTLPEGATVREPQSAAITAVRSMASPGMVVVEYPMGWGKTEIALWIAAWNANTWRIPGMYFAMPTMTTSDQLYDRVYHHLMSHLNGRKPYVNLVLTHGMSALRRKLREEEQKANPTQVSASLLQGEGELGSSETVADALSPADLFADRIAERAVYRDDLGVGEDPPGAEKVRAAAWFTAAKRGLLAMYGVGTVDQTFLATLQNPHYFVRMFALAGKTVVFDEVHGYDVYMSTIFDSLLTWLGAMGSPVVILSATLPRQRTEEMLAAYAKGAGWGKPEVELASYPRVSLIDASGSHSVEVESSNAGESTTIRLKWMPGDVSRKGDRWSPVARALVDALASGGNAAVICNTVREAQDAYRTLKEHFGKDEISLFHARFRQQERMHIQDRALDMFGKNPEKGRPKRHVLVATQVIEQSLDLDFDVMASMFCPVDLLLQRAGRLQRHRVWDGTRPGKFGDAAPLWLVGYEVKDGVPCFPSGSTAVYQEYVLARSWLALRSCDHIVIPNDVEALIEATYGDVSPSDISDNLTSRLQDLHDHMIDVWEGDVEIAKNSLLVDLAADEKVDVLYEVVRERLDADERPDVHTSRAARTRLGPPSVSFIVLKHSEAEQLGSLIDPDRKEKLELSEVQKLMPFSISVSNHKLVSAWRDFPNLQSWDVTAHLRYRRLIVLDQAGNGEFGGVPVRLDPELGLLIDSKALNGEESA